MTQQFYGQQNPQAFSNIGQPGSGLGSVYGNQPHTPYGSNISQFGANPFIDPITAGYLHQQQLGQGGFGQQWPTGPQMGTGQSFGTQWGEIGSQQGRAYGADPITMLAIQQQVLQQLLQQQLVQQQLLQQVLSSNVGGQYGGGATPNPYGTQYGINPQPGIHPLARLMSGGFNPQSHPFGGQLTHFGQQFNPSQQQWGGSQTPSGSGSEYQNPQLGHQYFGQQQPGWSQFGQRLGGYQSFQNPQQIGFGTYGNY